MGSHLREVFFLVGEGDVVLWSDASESPVRLPDTRARWEAIWSRRERIVEIAHSHPIGPIAFSREDETTMRALVTALGRPVLFSVVAPDGMIRRVEPVDEPGAGEDRRARLVEDEPWWTRLLRLASGMQETSRTTDLARAVAAPSEIATKEQ
ncbi:MAG: Mov34/MPN/PAD-1 family protein [Labilithrix sp.]|nr:Mov34/MPN/PAD-1 family protein [Labilithrix sp.]